MKGSRSSVQIQRFTFRAEGKVSPPMEDRVVEVRHAIGFGSAKRAVVNESFCVKGKRAQITEMTCRNLLKRKDLVEADYFWPLRTALYSWSCAMCQWDGKWQNRNMHLKLEYVGIRTDEKISAKA